MRKHVIASLVGCCLLSAGSGVVAAGGAGGVSGPAFYVDGQLYRTVNTPTDLSNTGAPASSFDTNQSGDFDSDEEVAAALAAGAAVDIGVVKSFVCPVIRLSRS